MNIKSFLLKVFFLIIISLLSGCNFLGSFIDDSDGDNDPIIINEISDYEIISTVIGRGYDIFETYADTEEVRSEILDFDKLIANDMIEVTSLDTTDSTEATGSQKSEYQESLGTTVDIEGSYGAFSGSVSSSFSSVSVESSSYSYGSIFVNIKKKMYKINTASHDIRDFLTESFENDLKNAEIEDLFEDYGTHVLVGVITGARFNYCFAEMTSEIHTESSISIDMESKFKSTFSSAAASIGITSESDHYSSAASETVSISVVGGDSNMAISNDSGYNTWLEGIDDDNIVFSNFPANGAMVPLWELCGDDDDARARAIEEAFYTYNETAVVTLRNITGTSLSEGGDDEVELSWYVYVEYPDDSEDGIASEDLSSYYNYPNSGNQYKIKDNLTFDLELSSSVDMELESGESFTVYITNVKECDQTGGDDICYWNGDSTCITYSKTFGIDDWDSWFAKYEPMFCETNGNNELTFNYEVIYY